MAFLCLFWEVHIYRRVVLQIWNKKFIIISKYINGMVVISFWVFKSFQTLSTHICYDIHWENCKQSLKVGNLWWKFIHEYIVPRKQVLGGKTLVLLCSFNPENCFNQVEVILYWIFVHKQIMDKILCFWN